MKGEAAPLLPGATIGILGGGQLGRMFALEAHRMGYRTAVLAPGRDGPAAQVADRAWDADYADLDALDAFAAAVDAVTQEFENVPAAALERLAASLPVRPAAAALATCQHRGREKRFLARAGLPHAPFVEIGAADELGAALERTGPPAVLKTAGFGYDGKGQRIVHRERDLAAAYREIGGGAAVLEGFVSFAAEVSVVAARDRAGRVVDHGVVENRHRDHILDLSLAPAGADAGVGPEVAAEARRLAARALEALDLVGVACVEFFVLDDGRLLVNEIAPRPHNSGHLTIEASAASQFEQQLRTVAGLPLGDGRVRRPAAMANLLGDLWANGEPDWAAALAVPGVRLHLYGKSEARPGRKMGHLTAIAEERDAAEAAVMTARAALER